MRWGDERGTAIRGDLTRRRGKDKAHRTARRNREEGMHAEGRGSQHLFEALRRSLNNLGRNGSHEIGENLSEREKKARGVRTSMRFWNATNTKTIQNEQEKPPTGGIQPPKYRRLRLIGPKREEKKKGQNRRLKNTFVD